jgi:hypothetical protein
MRWSRQHSSGGLGVTFRVRLEAAGFAVRLFGRGESALAETNYCSSKENAFAKAELVLRKRYPSHVCHDGCTDWVEELEPVDPPALSPGGR